MERHLSVLPNTRKGARRESEGLWDWNLVSNRIHFSPGWIALAGCQPHEMGTSPDEWIQRVHPDDSQKLLNEIEAAQAEGAPAELDLRYRLRHKDGTYRWMYSRGLIVRNDAGEAIRLTGTQADVTVETVTDPVTGLPNRLLLVERLTQSIARARRHSNFHFALLLVDLGRPSGSTFRPRPDADPLLNATARRLETCLRLPDALPDLRQNDLVARVEGDQIAVLLDGLRDLHHAKTVGDRVLEELLNPLSLNGREARLTPTIGVALSASGYGHADEAMRDAETALHRARVLGGSHCEVFDTDVLKSEQSALQLEGELELALQRGEFQLAYQPIVSLTSNEVVGFEALVRWHHPALGSISPLDFIPLAEKNGLIVPLGQWILQEACLQLKAWQTGVGTARDLWVSVNLSGVQLRDAKLAEQIESTLRSADIEPRSLVLELTEGVAMDNPVAVTTLLMRLRAIGVRISIDDFGTGYSSLAYLRQFPVDGLKIDQSFVRAIAHDKDTAAIVTSIVSMAKELGLYVVAEGVEKEGQLAKLQQMQCESAQGHLFSEPLDAKSAEDFLNAGPPIATAAMTQSGPEYLPRRLAHLRQWSARTFSGMSKELLLTGAVITVLASAGVRTLLHEGPVPTGSTTPIAQTGPLETAGDESAFQTPINPGTPDATGPSRAVAIARSSPDSVAVTPGPSKPASPPLAPTPPPTPPSTPVPTPAAKAFLETTFDVVHLHRMGRCQGRLVVSRTGVEFVPEKPGDDAFVLKHGEFVQGIDRQLMVTIRSADRIYRFGAPGGSQEERAATQLAIADAIARSRER